MKIYWALPIMVVLPGFTTGQPRALGLPPQELPGRYFEWLVLRRSSGSLSSIK